MPKTEYSAKKTGSNNYAAVLCIILFNDNNNKIKNKIFLFIYFLSVQRLCFHIPVVARVPMSTPGVEAGNIQL